MKAFVLSVAAALVIGAMAALILNGLGWDSATVHQSSANVRL